MSFSFQNNVSISQHKTLKDRCEAAKMIESHICSVPAPVCVDSPENEALTSFGAWPERLYVLREGKIAYEGGTGPHNYNIEEVRKWLEEYKAGKSEMGEKESQMK